MLKPKVKVTGIVFATLLFMTSGVWFSSVNRPKAQADEAKASKLKVLLKQKLLIVQEFASQMNELHRVGDTSFAQVHEATQAVRNAELELCDTSQERVAVLEKMLAEAKDCENQITRLVESGGGVSPGAVAKAKVNRLDVEIALERAKAN